MGTQMHSLKNQSWLYLVGAVMAVIALGVALG